MIPHVWGTMLNLAAAHGLLSSHGKERGSAFVLRVVLRISVLALVLLSWPARSARAGDPSKPLDFADAMRRIESLQESGELRRADALVGELLETGADRLTAHQRRQLEYWGNEDCGAAW